MDKKPPRDPAKLKEWQEKEKDRLDEQLMKFNQRNGGNTEIFKQEKTNKLDEQLQAFMEAAQTKDVQPDANAATEQPQLNADEEAKDLEPRMTRSASKREVIDEN